MNIQDLKQRACERERERDFGCVSHTQSEGHVCVCVCESQCSVVSSCVWNRMMGLFYPHVLSVSVFVL